MFKGRAASKSSQHVRHAAFAPNTPFPASFRAFLRVIHGDGVNDPFLDTFVSYSDLEIIDHFAQY